MDSGGAFFRSFAFSGVLGFYSFYTCFESFYFSGKVDGVGGKSYFFVSYLSDFVSIFSYFTSLVSIFEAGVVLASFD